MESKPRTAVLMGGRSLEREVSLRSGRRVSTALKSRGYEVIEIDVDQNLIENLKKASPDIVYIALHGKYGEDGSIQEVLEIMRIPYTGPGVYPNILGIDKVMTKHVLKQAGISTARFHALSAGAFKDMGASSALPSIIADFGMPLVVKPSAQGSALGLKVVDKQEDLATALLAALSYDDKVLIEEYIDGTEISVSVIGNDDPVVLPIVEVIPHKDWFDFEARYTMGMSDYYVPARLEKPLADKINATALEIYGLFKCKGLSRIDIIIKDETPYVLELNTSPGLTETSLLPMAAKAYGLEFEDLVEKIIEFGLETFNKQIKAAK